MSVDAEIRAMSAVAGSLDSLDEEARGRVLRWAADRYKVAAITRSGSQPGGLSNGEGATSTGFQDLATLFSEASPRTEAEKALVAGYWLQIGEGAKDWESQPLNTALKNLGHRLSNVTDCLSALIDRRPSLVIQVAKSGTTRQARKRYKLTTSGISEVGAMLRRGAERAEE
jgi:hypothetical protein